MKRRATASFAILGLAILAVLFVPALRTEADWMVAALRDTREAYAAYAADWPADAHRRGAGPEDDRAWQIAERARHDRRVRVVPGGACAAGPTRRRPTPVSTTSAWADALDERSAAVLERYLQAFPYGRHLDAAQATLEEVRWRDALPRQRRRAGPAYIATYRDGRFAAPPRAASTTCGGRTPNA